MKPETLYGILAFAAIGVVIFIFMQLKEKKNKRLAESGEDKARLKDVADRVFAGINDCHTLYGHYEDVEITGDDLSIVCICAGVLMWIVQAFLFTM